MSISVHRLCLHRPPRHFPTGDGASEAHTGRSVVGCLGRRRRRVGEAALAMERGYGPSGGFPAEEELEERKNCGRTVALGGEKSMGPPMDHLRRR